MQNTSGKTALGLDANIGAMLCYLPICAISLIYSIIVLVADKENKLVRFHAFQSLLITAVYIVVIVAISVFGGIVAGVTGSGLLGSLISLFGIVAFIVFLIVMILGCVKGFQAQMWKLPVVGDMADKWSN
ncbi:MAG: hypothetical protein KIS76_04235 [Pyrinomonadaceae bacterium]|nr:hypothetical protein [Pyrinomonadaceae bacterium]